jgi:hypothetical protein
MGSPEKGRNEGKQSRMVAVSCHRHKLKVRKLRNLEWLMPVIPATWNQKDH